MPKLLDLGFDADIVTDQTSAHDPLSYVPTDLTPTRRWSSAPHDPDEYVRRSRQAMATHCEAMVGFIDAGAEVFDYGNSLRAEARLGGFERALRLPRLPARVHPPAVLRGKGSVPLGRALGRSRGHRGDRSRGLEEFPDDVHLAPWLRLAEERVAFQGLPARICWLGYGERARFGRASTRWCGPVRSRRRS